MPSIKTTIKNDLWRWNYIVPFVNKHRFDEKGKADLLRHIAGAYWQIRPVRAHGGGRYYPINDECSNGFHLRRTARGVQV